MGCNSRATVYYGIQINKDEDEFDEHDANDAWAKANRPAQPNNGNYEGQEWDAWRVSLREYEGTLRHVEIDWSGSEECHSYYVHCPALEKQVEWEEQLALDLQIRFYEVADRNIREFCEKFGLPYSQPGWHLCVRYF